MSEWLRACSTEDLKDGQMLGVVLSGKRILIASVRGKIAALDGTCTHEDAALETGFLTDEGVRCPLHLSVFRLEDGAPLNPPADRPLRAYNVKIEGGAIYVEA